MINEPVASLWPAETWKTFYLSFVSGFKHTQLRFVTKNNFALVHLRHLSLRKEIAACVITAFTQEQITTHRSIFLSGIFEDAALAVLCLKEGFSVPNQKHKPISWFIFERFSAKSPRSTGSRSHFSDVTEGFLLGCWHSAYISMQEMN